MKEEKSYKNQRRKPKQARSLAKYNAVLDACSRVLTTHSYDKITMTEFSLESGLPYATIYQYFENKDDILVAWMVRLFDQIEDQIAQQKLAIANKSNSGMGDQVDGLIKTSVFIMANNQNAMGELMSAMPQMLTNRMLQVSEDRTVRLVQTLFSESLEINSQADVEYHIRIVTRMLIGFYMQNILSGRKSLEVERDGEEIAFLVKSYFQGRHLL